jgi:hypothetical protein
LRQPGSGTVADEGCIGGEIALLNAPMTHIDGPRRGWAVTDGREREDQRDISPPLRLVLFDKHAIVPTLVHNSLRHVALGQERVHRDHTAFQDQVLQDDLNGQDLIGVVVDGVWGEREAYMVRQRR